MWSCVEGGGVTARRRRRARSTVVGASHAAPDSGRRPRPGAVSQRPTHGACSTRTPVPSRAGSFVEQLVRAGEIAGDRIADAHGDRRRRGLALFDHVEVVVEGRDFVDLGHRQLHLGRERDQMRRRQAAVPILNLVQMFDQQIAPARRVAEQRERPLRALSDRRAGPLAWRARAISCPWSSSYSIATPLIVLGRRE